MAEQETNVIVAIPKVDDYVWKISSEKVPHLTLLYLEDLSSDPDLENIVEFLQHAVQTSLSTFWLEVDHRGPLGADAADVVFFSSPDGPDPLFSKDRDIKKLAQFRQTILQNPSISQAYNAVTQFPVWTPHLTLGYPTAPAKPDTRDYPGIGYVGFDKIALWTSDFEGIEFQLNEQRQLEVSMSDRVSDILAHHGVKGMKWGVRRDGSTASTSVKTSRLARPASDITVKQKPGQFVRTAGGKKHTAADDAVRVAAARQLAKKSTTDALSNKQLQDAVTRMNLEQQYSQLVKKSDRRTRGQKIVNAILGKNKSTKANDQTVTQTAKDVAGVIKIAKTAAKAAAA